MDINRDPIINVIYNGIKKDIRVAIENQCYRAAVLLIYSGIDTMAFLNMPSHQEDVTKKDFIEWAEKYIIFPGTEQLTGLDLYGARCGALHSYGTSSRLFREGQCRKVGYTDKNSPAVAYVPSINNSLVVVSIDAFADTFFNGVDKFLIDIYKDVDKAKVAEGRFDNIFHIYPMRSDSKKEGSV